WSLMITVDQASSEPFDVGADLTNFSQFHTMCGPQTFVITVLGRSSPHNNAVVTNPSTAGSYDWTGSFTSSGGGFMANASDSVCIGNACDADSDSRPDATDNCPLWPNAGQALPAWLIPANDPDCDGRPNATANCPIWPNAPQPLPPWPVPANDPDCDGFSTGAENAAGTGALAHCGTNAWPADINNDTVSDITDISALTGVFGLSVPPAPARYNIAPDPVDGFVDITDVSKMTAFFGLRCL